jgi:hypothetical protein
VDHLGSSAAWICDLTARYRKSFSSLLSLKEEGRGPRFHRMMVQVQRHPAIQSATVDGLKESRF